MAISLTGSGGLFTRLGDIAIALDDINALAGGTATSTVTISLVTLAATLEADYAAGTALYQVIDGFLGQFANAAGTGALQTSLASGLTALQTLAQSTLITMANADTPLSSPTLANAMALLISQMLTNGNYVNPSTVTAGAQTAFNVTPVGNPVFIASVKNPYGKTCEYAFAEKVVMKCTNDSVSGSATAKQEAFSIYGQNAQSNALAYNWGTSAFGSGGSITGYTLIDGAQNNSGNLLQNSEFVTATTANNPDNWTILVGTAGTDVFQATGTSGATGTGGYVDTLSLEFLSTGANVPSIAQTFNTTPTTTVGAGGTAGRLTAATQYAVNFWVKVNSTPGAGILTIDLVDSTNTAITDDAGTSNSFTKSLTAVSTTWVNVNGVFRTPTNLPTVAKLRIRVSTAITNTTACYIDRVSMAPMQALYTGGPSFAGFSALTNPVNGTQAPDAWSMTMTNAWAGKFQKFFERIFGMKALGLQLPSSGSSAISDYSA